MRSLSLLRSWFFCFTLYNLLFFSLQLVFILSKGGNFVQTIPLPLTVYFELAATLLTHLGLYLLLSIWQTILLWGLIQHQCKYVTIDQGQFAIWALSVCVLLSSNGYFFPLSEFSRLFFSNISPTLLRNLMIFSISLFVILTLNALFMAWKYSGFRRVFFSLSIAFLIVYLIPPTIQQNSQIKPPQPPNIIFIGIDSLSPASISLQKTPTINHLTKTSILFKETISPLAHTYPAWTSILTGLYPHHHGARYNLMPPKLVQSSASLAWNLQGMGYQTIFATDDRRFNTMGKEFGFQKIIGPKAGVNDIILGTFNDFPLSNLLVNLPISHLFFPYNYMNRASYYTYYPQTFDNALENELTKNKQLNPLFMAVHFTLPHWPYAWATSTPAQVKDEYSVEERSQLYDEALHRVDQQVNHLLNVLDHHGYLNNSLVILLSDHGEALYLPGSRQTNPLHYNGQGVSRFADYLKRKTSTTLDRSAGHGSDLLSPTQYHCLLAIQIYQDHKLHTAPRVIQNRVALIDINPTIKAFLNQPQQKPVDGISLLEAILNSKTLPHRHFIMESGMLPNQFLTREKARLLGKKFFTVNSTTGLLQLKEDKIKALDALKLYAIMEGDWVLALYPDEKDYISVILNLNNKQWTDELDNQLTQNSPNKRLIKTLKSFYNNTLSLKSH